ncbi:MFS transporter, partial [Ralstonia pseudosolanacearum]
GKMSASMSLGTAIGIDAAIAYAIVALPCVTLPELPPEPPLPPAPPAPPLPPVPLPP